MLYLGAYLLLAAEVAGKLFMYGKVRDFFYEPSGSSRYI